MKVNQLKKAFEHLQLIIHKKKYLIPQKPMQKNKNLYLSYLATIKQQTNFTEQQTKMPWAHRYKLLNDAASLRIKQKDPFYLKLKQQQEAKVKNYHQQLKQYQQKYIDPPNFLHKYNPYTYFLSTKLKKSKLKMQEIAKMWRQLSPNQKQQIQKQAQVQKNKGINKFKQYILNHKIPQTFDGYTGYSLYLSQHLSEHLEQKKKLAEQRMLEQIQSQITQASISPSANEQFWKLDKLIYQRYNNLPPESKSQYEKLAKQKQENGTKQLQKFLHKWKLSRNQFEYIKQICRKYNIMEQEKKKNKKLMPNIKKIKEQIKAQEDKVISEPTKKQIQKKRQEKDQSFDYTQFD